MFLPIHSTPSGAAEARLEHTEDAKQTKQFDVNWAWWFMPVVPVLRLGRIEFKSSLGYKSKPYLKKTQTQNQKTTNMDPIKIVEIATSSSKTSGQVQLILSIYSGTTLYFFKYTINFFTLKGGMQY